MTEAPATKYAFKKFLAFDDLTYIPPAPPPPGPLHPPGAFPWRTWRRGCGGGAAGIQAKLIDVELLAAEDVAALDAYHRRVLEGGAPPPSSPTAHSLCPPIPSPGPVPLASLSRRFLIQSIVTGEEENQDNRKF